MDDQAKKEFLISFGEKVRKLRKEKGLSQSQLADEIGVEISQISRIERGLINSKITTLYLLSKLLDFGDTIIFKK